MSNNPYGVQYGRSPQYQPTELLPSFRRIPPPEVLKSQARQNWEEYALPIAKNLVGQIVENATILGLTGKSLGDWGMIGANNAWNHPNTQATLGALAATRFAPAVNRLNSFVTGPGGQNAAKYARTILNWIF